MRAGFVVKQWKWEWILMKKSSNFTSPHGLNNFQVIEFEKLMSVCFTITLNGSRQLCKIVG